MYTIVGINYDWFLFVQSFMQIYQCGIFYEVSLHNLCTVSLYNLYREPAWKSVSICIFCLMYYTGQVGLGVASWTNNPTNAGSIPGDVHYTS